jgi:hypothetical protein
VDRETSKIKSDEVPVPAKQLLRDTGLVSFSVEEAISVVAMMKSS